MDAYDRVRDMLRLNVAELKDFTNERRFIVHDVAMSKHHSKPQWCDRGQV